MHWTKFQNTEFKELDFSVGGQGKQAMVSKIKGAMGYLRRPKLKVFS